MCARACPAAVAASHRAHPPRARGCGLEADAEALLDAASGQGALTLHFHPDRLIADGRSVAEALHEEGIYRSLGRGLLRCTRRFVAGDPPSEILFVVARRAHAPVLIYVAYFSGSMVCGFSRWSLIAFFLRSRSARANVSNPRLLPFGFDVSIAVSKLLA